jgi:hypothetical protein
MVEVPYIMVKYVDGRTLTLAIDFKGYIFTEESFDTVIVNKSSCTTKYNSMIYFGEMI